MHATRAVDHTHREHTNESLSNVSNVWIQTSRQSLYNYKSAASLWVGHYKMTHKLRSMEEPLNNLSVDNKVNKVYTVKNGLSVQPKKITSCGNK